MSKIEGHHKERTAKGTNKYPVGKLLYLPAWREQLSREKIMKNLIRKIKEYKACLDHLKALYPKGEK